MHKERGALGSREGSQGRTSERHTAGAARATVPNCTFSDLR